MRKPKNSYEAMTEEERKLYEGFLCLARSAQTMYASRGYSKNAKRIIDRAQKRFRRMNPDQYDMNLWVANMKRYAKERGLAFCV